jgi:hypothetical protein
MGEMIPFVLVGANLVLTPVAARLCLPIAEYSPTNLSFAPTGVFAYHSSMCARGPHHFRPQNTPSVPISRRSPFPDGSPISPVDRERLLWL